VPKLLLELSLCPPLYLGRANTDGTAVLDDAGILNALDSFDRSGRRHRDAVAMANGVLRNGCSCVPDVDAFWSCVSRAEELSYAWRREKFILPRWS
jgi:hypothetical protein